MNPYVQMPANQVSPAWKRLQDEYSSQGDRYHVATRPYHSSGAFKFEAAGDPIAVPGQLIRQLLVARAGQSIDFFSYAIGETVNHVGLGARPATFADTNLGERRETNDEDFAVMALSANPKGLRIVQRFETDGVADTEILEERPDLRRAAVDGSMHLIDPASLIVPPEIGSPLVLEDVLYQAISKRVHLQQTWNRKTGDDITLLRNIPSGGAESYLHANGEPQISNIYHLSGGYVWRREGSAKDSKWGIRAELVEDIAIMVSIPGALFANPTDEDEFLINEVWLDWQVFAHGNAFYYASENV